MTGEGGRDWCGGWKFRDGEGFSFSFFFFLVTLSLKHTHACTQPMSVHAVNSAQVHCSRVPGGGGTGECWGAEEEQ